jgi:hypothetical protein
MHQKAKIFDLFKLQKEAADFKMKSRTLKTNLKFFFQ